MVISSARPKTKPRSTDSEKNWAIRPSLRRPAAIDTNPASSASAAVSARNSGDPPGAISEIVAPDMMAIADDTATTSCRELPRAAYASRPIGAA